MSHVKNRGASKKKDVAPLSEATELDATTRANVRKVQQALGDAAPPEDVIVLYLREHRNNSNQVVDYLLDADDSKLWRGGGAKKTTTKKKDEVPIEIEQPREYRRTPPTSYEKPSRSGHKTTSSSSARDAAAAAAAKQRPRGVEASDARISTFVEAAPLVAKVAANASYVQKLKVQPAATTNTPEASAPAPNAPAREAVAQEEPDDDDIVVESFPSPKVDPTPTATATKPSSWQIPDEMINVASTATAPAPAPVPSPQFTAPVPQLPAHSINIAETLSMAAQGNVAPSHRNGPSGAASLRSSTRSLQLLLPLDIEGLVDAKLIFRIPHETPVKATPQPTPTVIPTVTPPAVPNATPVNASAPPFRPREEQHSTGMMTDTMFANTATSTATQQTAYSTQMTSSAPLSSSNDMWAAQPFTKASTNSTLGQRPIPSARPGQPWPQGGGYYGTPSVYAQYGGGGVSSTWGYGQAQSGYSFPPPPGHPGGAGRFPSATSGYGNPPFHVPYNAGPSGPYGRGGSGLGGAGGKSTTSTGGNTFAYNVTGGEDRGDHSEWNVLK